MTDPARGLSHVDADGAARALARHNIPVLGINRGNLGFLTDIRPDELEEKVAELALQVQSRLDGQPGGLRS